MTAMPDSLPQHQAKVDRTEGWIRGTPAKVFFIMVLALLPLAVAAIVSNWQSIHGAERDRAELMAAATRQNASQLASDINAIKTNQSLTANVIAMDSEPDDVCARMQALFNSMTGHGGIATVIFDRSGVIRCQSPEGVSLLADATLRPQNEDDVSLAPNLGGLLIRSRSRDGSLTALALYKRKALERLTNGNARDPHQTVILEQGDKTLPLTNVANMHVGGEGSATMRAQVGNYALHIIHSVRRDGARTRTLSLLMPLALWFSAAFLSWLVVRWTLIRPLISLRREVAAYEPGQIINPPQTPKLGSNEIVALGEAFKEMSKHVAEHDEDMRQALVRQTRLTREVHHRVKNNLQIISSLISLHWRAAPDPRTSAAYLSIQRRVDALSVVQRNHYAELEDQRGVRARAVLNEIAGNLQTSAQIQSGRNLNISVECDDVLLHLDVAAPVAFMTAELADLVIALDTDSELNLSLSRLPDLPKRARFTLSSPAFRGNGTPDIIGKIDLYERVLNGLARQLRTPLHHDAKLGEYHVIIPIFT